MDDSANRPTATAEQTKLHPSVAATLAGAGQQQLGTDLALLRPPVPEQQPTLFSASSLILDRDAMVSLYKLAEVMAGGVMSVPKHLQGNVADCLAVCMQAMQWGFNPFAVAQKTHLVNGALGYESQLIIAALNSSPLLAARVNWTWSDNWLGIKGKEDVSDEHYVQCFATLRGERQPRLLRVSMAQVGKIRNSPLWEADPRQQIGYLAAKRWGRLHAPDVILGVYSPDELLEREIVDGSIPLNASGSQTAAAAASKPATLTPRHQEMVKGFEDMARANGFEAFKGEWGKLSKADREAIGIPERDRIAAIGAQSDADRAAAAAAPQ